VDAYPTIDATAINGLRACPWCGQIPRNTATVN
jgi:hypothetical protein